MSNVIWVTVATQGQEMCIQITEHLGQPIGVITVKSVARVDVSQENFVLYAIICDKNSVN